MFRRLILTSLGCLAFGCNQPSPDSGFDRRTSELKLLPAPGGLCSGDGAKKECETGDCGESSGDDDSDDDGYAAADDDAADDDYYDDDFYDDDVPAEVDDDVPAEVDDDVADDDVTEPTEPQPGVDGGGLVQDAGKEPRPVGDDAGLASSSDAGPLMTPIDGGTADGGIAPDGADAGANVTEFGELRSALTDACGALDANETATLYLSADDSNSMASPVIARRVIRSGGLVPPAIVRPYEFLNYYDFAFEPAAPGEVRIVPQLSSCPRGGELNLQVALQSEARSDEDRKPLNVTFVLDTSGSMSGTPLALQRAAVHAMAGRFREGDVVSMVTWSVDQRTALAGHVVTRANDPAVLAAVDALEAEGGTDLSGGLRAGYELAERYRSSDRINRVVVISDGAANVGVTDETLIGRYADDEESEEGIYLAGVGVGAGVNDTLMNAVTDSGRGAYVYLDSPAEAKRMLGQRFLEVIDVAAREVRLELTLPWYMQVAKFYGEAISTDPEKVRPQHLGPNSAMVFFQVLEACDARYIHGDDRIRLHATWTTPFDRSAKSATIDATLNELAGDDRDIEKAAVIAGYAEALQRVGNAELPRASAAEILREALGHVTAAAGAGTDPDLVEVEELLRTYLLRFE